MTDDQKLIEEAATLLQHDVNTKWSTGWGATYRNAAENQRDFWAAHAEPAEVDTAKALRIAAEHVRLNHQHRDLDVAWSDLESEADRLDLEQRDQARAEKIGRDVRAFIVSKQWGDDSDVTLGRFILAQVEGGAA